jgi:copper chaperone
MMMTIELKVTGMTCQHCVRAVSQALASVPGVGGAAVTLESGVARVEGNVSAAPLIRAVVDAGYQAEEVVAE